MTLRVLVVEDNGDDAELVVRALRQAGHEVDWRRVWDASSLDAAFDAAAWDLVLTDHRMPALSSEDVLRAARTRSLGAPVIVVSGAIGEEAAAAAVREGAADVVSKDRLLLLGPAVARAFEMVRLRAVDRARVELLNTTTHELNTPLTPLRIQLHLLSTASLGELNDRQRHALEMVSSNVERMALLVRDVLDMSRIESGHLRIVCEPTDLAKIVDLAVEAFRAPAERAGIALEARVACDRPVSCDGARLTQALYNLLSNALKFTPPGGRVEVGLSLEADHAVIAVRDSGAGLTAEQQARLYRPFSQVHESKAAEGTGLGLFVSKGIVEAHGGRVWCASEGPGRGATFAFSVPLGAPGPASPP